ncbi:MAG: hypothetical protein AAGA72_03110 [Pseudomonadota bacterium]
MTLHGVLTLINSDKKEDTPMKRLIAISVAAAAIGLVSTTAQADAQAFATSSKKCAHSGCASSWQPNKPGRHPNARGSRTQDTKDTPAPNFPAASSPTHTPSPVPIPYPNVASFSQTKGVNKKQLPADHPLRDTGSLKDRFGKKPK